MMQGNGVMRKYDRINLTCNWDKLSALFAGRVVNILVKDSDCMIERYVFPYGARSASEPGIPHLWVFEIELRHSTLGRTNLDEWSARRRDLNLTKKTIVRDGHLCARRDSNAQSQQASGRRPKQLTARTKIFIPNSIWKENSRLLLSFVFVISLVLVLCGHPFRRVLCASL